MSDMVFNFDQVTPRMLVDFKNATGVSLLSMMGEDGSLNLGEASEECIAGIVWLSLRMSGHPDATFDDALDTPFVSIVGSEPQEPDPTNAS